MSRLTPEREKEIRQYVYNGEWSENGELLAEIDALRAENERLKEFYDDHVGDNLEAMDLRADLKWIAACAEDMFREGDKGYQIAIFAREALNKKD